MQPAGNYHEGYERVRQLSALFLRRLHEIAGEVYAEVLSSGAIRPEEMEEEIQRYFAKKKSGLQDVYSYYGEQWDYYYQVVAASDADFLPMLQQARSALSVYMFRSNWMRPIIWNSWCVILVRIAAGRLSANIS